MSDYTAYMPFWIGDYLSSTMHLTTEQHGAYTLLLFHYWKNKGPIPNDESYLASVAKMPANAWQKASKILAGFFEIRDGHLIHKRCEFELAKAKAKYAARVNAGRAGGYAKAEKQNPDEKLANGWQNSGKTLANGCQSESESVRTLSVHGNPTLEQWLTKAQFIGYDPKEAETAWNSLESIGWVNGRGQPIQKWEHYILVCRDRKSERDYLEKIRNENRKRSGGGNPPSRNTKAQLLSPSVYKAD